MALGLSSGQKDWTPFLLLPDSLNCSRKTFGSWKATRSKFLLCYPKGCSPALFHSYNCYCPPVHLSAWKSRLIRFQYTIRWSRSGLQTCPTLLHLQVLTSGFIPFSTSCKNLSLTPLLSFVDGTTNLRLGLVRYFVPAGGLLSLLSEKYSSCYVAQDCSTSHRISCVF